MSSTCNSPDDLWVHVSSVRCLANQQKVRSPPNSIRKDFPLACLDEIIKVLESQIQFLILLNLNDINYLEVSHINKLTKAGTMNTYSFNLSVAVLLSIGSYDLPRISISRRFQSYTLATINVYTDQGVNGYCKTYCDGI